MTSKKVTDAWNNYDIPDGGFMKRYNAAKARSHELLEAFTTGDHRPVLDAMQLIVSKANLYDWLVLRLDTITGEGGITVVLSTNGQYVVSDENEPLMWFNDPASAYIFAIERILEGSDK